MKRHLAPLLLGLALPCAAQPAPPPPPAPGAEAPAASPRAGEPEIKHSVIEDDATRIDETRVRGVLQRIVVTTKGRGGSTYEILPGDGSRDLSDGANTSRGAAGKRVWRVLDF